MCCKRKNLFATRISLHRRCCSIYCSISSIVCLTVQRAEQYFLHIRYSALKVLAFCVYMFLCIQQGRSAPGSSSQSAKSVRFDTGSDANGTKASAPITRQASSPYTTPQKPSGLGPAANLTGTLSYYIITSLSCEGLLAISESYRKQCVASK
jgi:hypothetical protein